MSSLPSPLEAGLVILMSFLGFVLEIRGSR
jgi:hypothetical protein